MVTLEGNRLVFRFPEIHPEAICSITFKRTLRLPDDGSEYPLPPGFENFPLAHVEDFLDEVPLDWRTRGGVFLPMYQAEAMWINFAGSYPCAVKVAAGKINVVTGKFWTNGLCGSPQDYVVAPGQRWIDGFCVEKSSIRQFVAMPLGEGFTAEEQLSGKAEFGGLQLCVYPMRGEFYDALQREMNSFPLPTFMRTRSSEEGSSHGMGLAPGGLMRQEIYKDRFGLKAWDTLARSRCYVHIANSADYLAVTGRKPPMTPPMAKDYTTAGLPWFEYYAKEEKVLRGSSILSNLEGIAARGRSLMQKIIPGNESVEPRRVIVYSDKMRDTIRDGEW
jgi:hypothetical protein